MPLLPIQLAEAAIAYGGEHKTATHRVMARYLDAPGAFVLAVGCNRDVAEDYAHAHRRHLEDLGPVETGRRMVVAAMWREEWVPGKGWVEA